MQQLDVLIDSVTPKRLQQTSALGSCFIRSELQPQIALINPAIVKKLQRLDVLIERNTGRNLQNMIALIDCKIQKG